MEDLFYYLTIVFDCVTIALAMVVFFKGFREREVLIISAYCLLNTIVNLSILFLVPKTYRLISGCFTIFEYVLFSALIYAWINSEKFKKGMKIASVAYLLIAIPLLLLTKKFRLDSVSIGLEAILVFVYCFWYLYEQLNNNVLEDFIYNKPQFWFVVGMLLYLGGSFFIYTFAVQLDKSVLKEIWFLTYIFYILKSVFFIVGLTFIGRHKKVVLPTHLNATFS